jgi:hypothetical protein
MSTLQISAHISEETKERLERSAFADGLEDPVVGELVTRVESHDADDVRCSPTFGKHRRGD